MSMNFKQLLRLTATMLKMLQRYVEECDCAGAVPNLSYVNGVFDQYLATLGLDPHSLNGECVEKTPHITSSRLVPINEKEYIRIELVLDVEKKKPYLKIEIEIVND